MCFEKKEMKLKYELENNVNLVSFSNMNIEISFNDKLNKNFVKDLSEKLYDWTKNRWLISFSKEKGEMSEKRKKKNLKKKNITEYKSSNEYKNLLKALPDIELIDIEKKMTDFNKILEKAKEIEKKMKESQENLKKIEVNGVSGGDVVKITLNGDGEMTKILLSDKVLKEDKEIIQDLITAAHNDAKNKLKSKTSEEISKATGGLGVPGFKWPL